MKNPHNAAADALVARHLDCVLYEIGEQQENSNIWIIRLLCKPGIASHPLHGAEFEVTLTPSDSSCEVGLRDGTASSTAALEFCNALVRAIQPPNLGDDDW